MLNNSPFRSPAKEVTIAAQALNEVTKTERLTDEEAAKLVASAQVSSHASVPSAQAKPAAAKEIKSSVESKTSTEINLNDLNETTLLKYPIKAKQLNEGAMATIRPISSSIVFRWVYFNNGPTSSVFVKDKISATNVGRYRYWGFDFATVEDIQGGEDALTDGIIDDGGRIINYDTVLMKIDKIRLMQHYKQNLINSINNVDNALGKAIKSAENDVVQTADYQKAMRTNPTAKIEFFSPGA